MFRTAASMNELDTMYTETITNRIILQESIDEQGTLLHKISSTTCAK